MSLRPSLGCIVMGREEVGGGKERKQTLHPLAVAFQSLQEPLIYYGSMAVDSSVVEISYRNDFFF